jgi:hypothetical protein
LTKRAAHKKRPDAERRRDKNKIKKKQRGRAWDERKIKIFQKRFDSISLGG